MNTLGSALMSGGNVMNSPQAQPRGLTSMSPAPQQLSRPRKIFSLHDFYYFLNLLFTILTFLSFSPTIITLFTNKQHIYFAVQLYSAKQPVQYELLHPLAPQHSPVQPQQKSLNPNNSPTHRIADQYLGRTSLS